MNSPEEADRPATMSLAVTLESLKALVNTHRYPAAAAVAASLLEEMRDSPQLIEVEALSCVAYMRLGRLREAHALLERAMARKPDHPLLLAMLGEFHNRRGDIEAANRIFARLHALAPDDPQVITQLAFTNYYRMPQRPAALASETRAWASGLKDSAKRVPEYQSWPTSPEPERRLRIGVVSPDLHDHPVGYFFETLLAGPADDVEWIAFQNATADTPLTRRLRAAFSDWHQVASWSDAQLADAVRRERIDILIDLAGHTNGNRLGVFMARPCPLQLTWLGFHGTTGLECFDAALVDPTSVPAAEAAWFSEPLAYLPQTRLCMAAPTDAPDIAPLPALRTGHITFGSMQRMEKLNDAVLAVWGAIAAQVPEARFRIQCGQFSTPELTEDFTVRLARFGLDDARTHRVGHMTRTEYLASYGEVDIVLDTFSYPGGTTTAEALWMGVPVLAYATPGMLGRQGEMMLSAAGLPEWIARNTQDYIAKAVHWAQPDQWPALATLRANMREHLVSQPLFDQATFAAHWHARVRQLWRERCARGWPTT